MNELTRGTNSENWTTHLSILMIVRPSQITRNSTKSGALKLVTGQTSNAHKGFFARGGSRICELGE